MVTASADRRARVALAVEGDRWVASLGGYHDDHPPMDGAGFLALAETLASGDVAEIVHNAEPLSDPLAFRYSESRRLPRRWPLSPSAMSGCTSQPAN